MFETAERINELLERVGIPLKLAHLQECVSLIWIAVAEGLLNERIEGIIRPVQGKASLEQVKVGNIRLLLDWLSEILGVSLSHIEPELLVRMDEKMILFMTEIFESLCETLDKQHVGDASSVVGDASNISNGQENIRLESSGVHTEPRLIRQAEGVGPVRSNRREEEDSFFFDEVSSIHSKSINQDWILDPSIMNQEGFKEESSSRNKTNSSASNIQSKSRVSSDSSRSKRKRPPSQLEPDFTLSFAKDDVQEFIDKQDLLSYSTLGHFRKSNDESDDASEGDAVDNMPYLASILKSNSQKPAKETQVQKMVKSMNAQNKKLKLEIQATQSRLNKKPKLNAVKTIMNASNTLIKVGFPFIF